MRAYAAANGMTVRLDPGKHGGAFLTYKCESGDECRFKVMAHCTKSEGQKGYVIGKDQLEHNQCGRVAKLTSAQIRHEPLVISLVASDASISRAIAEHVQRLQAALISENETVLQQR
ncbi:hypothetical protein PHMEG_00034767 [Phytophthora megakarya]|uniref:Uncharacterized protein n=1 Tax=Phytophthora megakarya TaxID=4795 RepID=A0A225UQN3_9STRA|nr:hypothetical protein PHMEG_00034767 [Phytophthora megakarya]